MTKLNKLQRKLEILVEKRGKVLKRINKVLALIRREKNNESRTVR